MANHWAIAIGINQYQFFQPLSYAQADAQTLWQFLVDEAGWSADECLLLTDTSPPISDQSTYPTKENLLDWFDEWCHAPVNVDDSLWFFFSGYGMTLDGEDYLMPSQGDPDEIAETGISVRSLFTTLKESAAKNILVLLDINRSQGGQAGAKVGAQTLELAQTMGIATVLSCQVDQFSYEASSLGHGLFTAVLLEGLRYNQGKNLESLERYLRSHLPELSEHHWRPVQIPLSAIPSSASNYKLPTLLPNGAMNWNATLASDTPPVASTSGMHNVGMERQEATPGMVGHNNVAGAAALTQKQTSKGSETNYNPSGIRSGIGQGAIVPQTSVSSTRVVDDTPWWLNLLLWCGGIALIVALIGGVFLRNRAAFIGQQAINTSTNATPGSTTPAAVSLQSASSGSKSQNAAGGTETQAGANQAVLDKARTLIVPNQASQFSQAIAEAQKIKPGEPLYEQAQQDIARWSGVILDLANGRAKQGQFDKAIAAARLVPEDNQSIYKEAQGAIASWREKAQQQRTNKILLQSAQGLIQPGQASSYTRAIAAVRKVPPDQPGYTEAQQLIAQWSKTIYQTAQTRASDGRLKEAIQTAALVPKDTPTYTTAQKAIDQWQKKVQGTK
ncbi:caspase family protein [Coleofasciculus sp. FACHB-129]|uniref:caspase family protein n=1 Tax=Cyanophyceae TaxID=3028117 RepID=UPI001683758E|nr:caspase family protein [Coleofasciculus sp. FACHB-129]MBD1894955.1 caspase family protein [Coleofasciculus sp. FACHB-129]